MAGTTTCLPLNWIELNSIQFKSVYLTMVGMRVTRTVRPIAERFDQPRHELYMYTWELYEFISHLHARESVRSRWCNQLTRRFLKRTCRTEDWVLETNKNNEFDRQLVSSMLEQTLIPWFPTLVGCSSPFAGRWQPANVPSSGLIFKTTLSDRAQSCHTAGISKVERHFESS